MSIANDIRSRKSTRTYDKEAKLDFELLEVKINEINNKVGPFGNKIKVTLVNSNEDSSKMKLGTYGMIKGASSYLVVTVKEATNIALDIGYLFEELVLYATNLGFDTCWMAGTFSRGHFSKAINLQDDEVIPIVSPIGKAATKKSFVDKYIVSAKPKTRKPYETLFFDNQLQPLSLGDSNERQGLELVRLAPSGMNRQSWRVVEDGNRYHFYATSKGDSGAVDVGIAIAHFDLYMKEQGIVGDLIVESNEILDNYIATWILK